MHYVQEAQKILRHFREQDDQCVIGFCNGCFDGLHGGHQNLLIESAMVCSVLVVGLNSDQYIKRVKNRNPLFTYDERVISIANYIMPRTALMIIEQQQDTPLSLIMALGPKVLIKSPEYENTEEVRYMIINKQKVVFVPRIPNISSSNLAEGK